MLFSIPTNIMTLLILIEGIDYDIYLCNIIQFISKKKIMNMIMYENKIKKNKIYVNNCAVLRSIFRVHEDFD